MALKEFHCLHCGAPLEEMRPDGTYHCSFCDHVFKDESLQKEMQTIELMFEGMLSKQKEEQIANARRNLYESVHEKYISSNKVVGYCREMKKLLPDDFQANFYEVANSGTPIEINRFLDSADVVENDVYASDVVGFMIRSLDSKNVLSVKSFIERGKSFGVFDSDQYTDLVTRVEEEAEKLEEGIYSTILPRDVFIAYSSADMNRVNEIADFLEENEITCFTAVRNLRHGRGSKENYLLEIQSALKHCKCVVFLSSENSRRLACDALRIELPYVQENLPKMGRIEFLINDYGPATSNSAKKILEGFFSGMEYCRTLDDLHTRVLKYTTGIHEEDKAAEEEIRRQKEDIERQRKELEEYKKKQQEELERIREEFFRQSQQINKPVSSSNNVEFYDRNLFDISGTKLEKYKGNGGYIEVPNGITDIAPNAFKGSAITGVKIPDSVVYIGDYAFANCEELMSVFIPESVLQIGKKAFTADPYLTIFTSCSDLPSLWGEEFLSDYHIVWDFQKSASEAKEEGKRNAEEVRRVEREQFEKEQAEKEHREKETAEAKRRQEEKKAKFRQEVKEAEKFFEFSGSKLLKYKGNLENVVIPEWITSIQPGAFKDCTILKNITIPSSVEFIAKDAFYNCVNLVDVHIVSISSWCNILFETIHSNPLRYAKNLYLNGNLVTELTIPNNIRKIGKLCFGGYKALTSVTIPEKITHICKEAFLDCTSLMNVTISNMTTHIEERAFCECTKLKNIKLPEKLTSIGDYAFARCDSLEEITVPESVNSIGVYVFNNCKSLAHVFLPSSLTKIPDGMLYGCTGLTSFTISDRITSIGNNAFANCNGLTSISIPDSVLDIGEWAFHNCFRATELRLPNKLTTIRKNAFSYCSSLRNVTIPASVTTLEEDAFACCMNLRFVYLPSSVSVMKKGAFRNGHKYLRVFTPLKAKPAMWMDSYNFVFNYQDTPEQAKKEMDSLIEKLKQAEAYFDISKDGHQLLKYKGNEEKVVIPEEIEVIAEEAFKNHPELKSVTFPKSLKSVGRDAFEDSLSIKEVHIQDIAAWCHIDFANPSSIPFKSESKLYVKEEEVTNLIIPDTVKEIKMMCFKSCHSIRKVIIPSSVKTIHDYAFGFCWNLSEMIISEGVQSFGNSVFYFCDKLTIYCRAKKKPDSWQKDWNLSKEGNMFSRKCCKVVWGYKG